MKICLANNLFAPYARGGAEKVVAAMLKNYQAEGHEIFLITTKPKKPNLNSSNNSELADLKIFYLDSDYYNLANKSMLARFFWHLKNLYDFKKYNSFQEILNQEKPDLVITHNLMGLGFISAQAIKLSGAKHHHFLHDIQLLHPSGLMFFGQENFINSLPAKAYQKITRHLIGSPDLIISPSNWLLKEHQNKGFFINNKTQIVSLKEILNLKRKDNAVVEVKQLKISSESLGSHQAEKEKKLSQNNLEEKNKNTSPKVFLFAGQIEEHKGIIFLIKAFKKLAHPDMILRIAGSGQVEKKAKKLAGNDKRFQFLGQLKKNDLEEELKQADFLIMPSLCYENSPTIILEAKNFHLKVIASNLGGIPEIIAENDILFKPGDAHDLFAKINSL